MIDRCLSPNNKILKDIYNNINHKKSSTNNKESKLKRFYNLFIKTSKDYINKNKEFKKFIIKENLINDTNIQNNELKYKNRIENIKYQIIQIKTNIINIEKQLDNKQKKKSQLFFHNHRNNQIIYYNPKFINDNILHLFYNNIGLQNFIQKFNLLSNQKNIDPLILKNYNIKLQSYLQILNKEFRIQYRLLWEIKKNIKATLKEKKEKFQLIIINILFVSYLIKYDNEISFLLDINNLKTWLSQNINISSIISNIDKQNLNKQLNDIENQINIKSYTLQFLNNHSLLNKDYNTFFNFHLDYWNKIGKNKFQNINQYLIFLKNLWKR